MRAPSKQFFYNYTLGYPYQDKSIAFHDEDVLDHIDHNYKRPLTRNGYKLVATGIDWGAEYHHVVTLGMRPNGQIDLMNLTRVPKSTGVEHIEEDLRAVVQVLRQYEPDIILPDRGYSGNYVDLLAKAFGQEHVFGVVVRSALSNGDPSAHFNESDGTVTIDKLTQNVITMGNIKRGDIHFWDDSNHDQEVIRLINHAKNVIIRTDERENKQTHLLEYDKVILRKGGDHYFQSLVYAMVGLNKLMKEEAQKRQISTQIDYIDSSLFQQDRTDLQNELDIKGGYDL